MRAFHLDIVSAESQLFAGSVIQLFVSGMMGNLEVLCGHTPFLTLLKPGPAWIVTPDRQEEVFYISGGVLEVQPQITTLLADTALRARDVDKNQALEAKARAEQILNGQAHDFNHSKAQAELTRALAQLQVLKKFRKHGKMNPSF